MDVKAFAWEFTQAVAVEGIKAFAVLVAFVTSLLVAIMLASITTPEPKPTVERATPICAQPEWVEAEINEILRI